MPPCSSVAEHTCRSTSHCTGQPAGGITGWYSTGTTLKTHLFCHMIAWVVYLRTQTCTATCVVGRPERCKSAPAVLGGKGLPVALLGHGFLSLMRVVGEGLGVDGGRVHGEGHVRFGTPVAGQYPGRGGEGDDGAGAVGAGEQDLQALRS